MSRVLLWIAGIAAVVLTASGEYALYRSCGFGQHVAAAGPVCLDAYLLATIWAGREVAVSMLVMVATNATAHLLPPTGPPHAVVVAVSALAPVVLWRVHALTVHTCPAPRTMSAEFAATPADGLPHDHPAVPVLVMPPVASTTGSTVLADVEDDRGDDHENDRSPDPDMTDTTTRRAARRLNTAALKTTGRPVTIGTLRTELGLSRRTATAMRQHLISTG